MSGRPRPPRTYSRAYLGGWCLPILFYAAPITGYADVDPQSIATVLLVVVVGYVAIWIAESRPMRHGVVSREQAVTPRRYWRIVLFFSVLSLIGGQLVLTEQANFLGGFSFENLQERYIALIASSNEGSATHSLASTIGNLLRATFFVAVGVYVLYTKVDRSFLRRGVATIIVGAALAQSFFVNVSRLQFVFYLIYAVVVASQIRHPMLRHKNWILAGAAVCVLFLVRTTDQRLATFADSSVAADAMMGLFGADLQWFGQYILDHVGLAALILSLYMTQGIPEFVRLVAYNASPYALGSQSFFLVVAPLARALGSPLQVDMTLISNQGLWWGLLGDLYLDVGEFYPIAYPLVLYAMVRIARRYEQDGPFALAFRALTVALILIVPYTGIFNTFAASYLALWGFAVLEKAARRARSVHGAELDNAQSA